MKHPLSNTRNGKVVYVDLIHSKAAKRVSEQPHLLNIVDELLSETAFTAPVIRRDYNMGRDIGKSYIVSTTDRDNILYAQRYHEKHYQRFVKNRKPELTKYISLVMEKDTDGSYQLLDVWIGAMAPPDTDSPAATPQSEAFWNEHAYILDHYAIQPRTITKDCPY